jgi:transposase
LMFVESGPVLTREELLELLAARDAQLTARDAEIAELRVLIERLEAMLRKDSSNSGRPPSSDSPFVKKPAPKRSSRVRSGRRAGKQPGAGSSTLEQVAVPDEIVECAPACCAGCGADLADAPVYGLARHQVVDVPPAPPKAHVTEYRVQSRACAGCGTVTGGSAPDAAAGRVAYGAGIRARAVWLTCGMFLPVRRAARVLGALVGMPVSTGFTASVRAQAAALLAADGGFLDTVRSLIASAPVAHADETVARADGALRYLHIACTQFLTVMHTGDRSGDAIDAGRVWPAFTGVLVRDGYSGYAHLTGAVHAWCGAHLVRDLRAVFEGDRVGQSWADAMGNTLVLANQAAHEARGAGREALAEAELALVRNRYRGALAYGRTQNATGRDPLTAEARRLLRRFERYEEMILRFATDLRVPFTNNTAELDARTAKVQQRTSGGCWRTLQGLADWAVVQSYLATARKWGVDTLDALVKLFTDGAWLPTGLTPNPTAP